MQADSSIEILLATESIKNATGTDWNSFQFALSGAAVFDGVGDVFVPQFGTGVDYSSVNLLPGHVLLNYTGSQSNGSTSFWGSSNIGDDLLIDPQLTDGLVSFSLSETPTGSAPPPPGVVPLPTAAWQSLLGLLALAAVHVTRRLARMFA